MDSAEQVYRRPRPRRTVPRPLIWLLAPVYRRSKSRSSTGYELGTVYILRGIGTHGFGPVLRIDP